jgi:bifunctional DNA-binding transcriptional regulator/antitoxin component of YhaV-PrlF toxin-antitoxin module
MKGAEMGCVPEGPEVFRLKIVSKRQVTLPVRLLNRLHLREGDEIEIGTLGETVSFVRPLKLFPTSLFSPEVLRQLDEREASMNPQEALSKIDANPTVLS